MRVITSITRENGQRPAHFKRPSERPFTPRERDHVTVLFGGLTLRHDRLIDAALTGLGHKVARLELSNFKCGHDAPIHSAVEEIVENSGTSRSPGPWPARTSWMGSSPRTRPTRKRK